MRRRGCPLGALVWLAALVSLTGPALAHEVRPAYLQLTELEPQRFEVVWKQPVLADRRLNIAVTLPKACSTLETFVPERTGGALIERWHAGCDLRSGTLGITGLSATLTDALLRISYLNGDTVSRLLRPAQPSLDLADPTPGPAAYFMLGVEHLLLGIDHVLFVIGLVLFIRTPWTLVKAVTAFTAAHSVTLALSVLGLVSLPQGPVEAVIALSILFLARELMVEEHRRSRITSASPWVVAFAFGLLHGFGFAGALADIGLPRDQLAAALALFNLGIEAGQLAVIAAMLTGAWLLQRLWNMAAHGVGGAVWQTPLATRAFSAAMGCVAGYWTIDRVIALA